MMRLMGLALALTIFMATSARAGFAEGEAAYKRGDYAAALRELQPLAEQGDAHAQAYVGYLNETGRGVPANPAAAILWYKKAIAQAGKGNPAGVSWARYNLAAMLREGRGGAKDAKAAAALFEQAALQNEPDAQYQLGVMLHSGEGISADVAKAITWFKKAAGNGLHDALTNLGAAYFEGQGVPQSNTIAYALFHANTLDQRMLGVAPADVTRKREIATRNRETVGAKMSVGERGTAQALAKELVQPAAFEKTLAIAEAKWSVAAAQGNTGSGAKAAPAKSSDDSRAMFGLMVGTRLPETLPECIEKDLFSEPVMPANAPYCLSKTGTGMEVLLGGLPDGLTMNDIKALQIIPLALAINNKLYDTSITPHVTVLIDSQRVIQRIKIRTLLVSNDAILKMLLGKYGKPTRQDWTEWTNRQTGARMDRTPNYFWDLPGLYVDYVSRVADMLNMKTALGSIEVYTPTYSKTISDYLRRRDGPKPGVKPM